jgi:uncharacterized protein HemX
MEGYPENGQQQEFENAPERFSSHTNGWLIVIAAILLVAAGLGFNYGFRQQEKVVQITS